MSSEDDFRLQALEVANVSVNPAIGLAMKSFYLIAGCRSGCDKIVTWKGEALTKSE